MITYCAAPTNRCRNLSTFLQLPRVLSSSSLLLMMLTKTFLDSLTHSMEWVILQTVYWVGPHEGNPTLHSENGWATSCWPHLDPWICYIFCGVILTETRNTEVPDCIDPTTSDLKWKISFPRLPGLSKSKRYTRIRASVLSILCHDRHWPWRNTDLCDTAKRYSTMFIFMYDHPSWWKSRAKQPARHCAMTWWNSHHYKFTWGCGSHHDRLESLVMTCTYLCWKHMDPHLRR